jgi:NRPS condensation-like uncharacterized protein
MTYNGTDAFDQEEIIRSTRDNFNKGKITHLIPKFVKKIQNGKFERIVITQAKIDGNQFWKILHACRG